MLARLERKLAEVQRWADSVLGFGDVPAALALAFFRTRPADGESVFARLTRRLVPEIWIRPASLNGWAIRIQPSDLSQFVIYEEVFIQKVYDLSRVGFDPDCVIDCGAFQGYFSLLAAAHFHQPALAFEPNAANYAALIANVRRNGAPIEARPAAVSTRDGAATFAGGGCGGRLSDDGDAVRVPVEDLRRIIRERRCERLLLKLDIEGEEAQLLPVLLPDLPHRTAIFFEWHQGRSSFDQVCDVLSHHGFSTVETRANLADGALYIDAFAQR